MFFSVVFAAFLCIDVKVSKKHYFRNKHMTNLNFCLPSLSCTGQAVLYLDYILETMMNN